jgi:5-methylthioadenosine/S-adenosylhomocysteine deaminase
MRRSYQLAQKWDGGMHIHVAETRVELEMDRKTKGMGHIEWLASLGQLAPSTQLVHSVWLSDNEIDLIADAGSVVVHCPASNMYLGSGICQVKRLRERGIRVALGLDGACNNGLGMIDLLKWAANLQQVAHLDAPALKATDVLEMACWDGAAAFGQPANLGSLEQGKKADIVLVDRNSTRLALATAQSLPVALVYTACSADVDTVIVDGEILLQDGKVRGIDEAALVAEAEVAWEAVLQRAGIAGVA